jgi:hypothetical protein
MCKVQRSIAAGTSFTWVKRFFHDLFIRDYYFLLPSVSRR